MIANDKINGRFIGSCANKDHCVSELHTLCMCVRSTFSSGAYFCSNKIFSLAFAVYVCTYELSISVVLMQFSWHYFILVFCLGFFCSHLFSSISLLSTAKAGKVEILEGRLKTNFHRNENLLSKFKIGNGHPIGIYLSWTLVSRKPNGQEYNPMKRTITTARHTKETKSK